MDHTHAIENHAVERYLMGALPAEERDAFEEHYFGCPECAREVCAGARFRANAREALERGAAAPAARSRWWSWPSLVPVAASLVFAGVVWYQARQPMAMSAVPYVVHETTRGAESERTRIPRGGGLVSLNFEIPGDRAFSSYDCVLQDAAGRMVAETKVDSRRPGETAQVVVRRDRLHAGIYTLTLRSAGAPVAQYTFEME